MTITYCDRCGTANDVKRTEWHLMVEDPKGWANYHGDAIGHVWTPDLCADCTKKFFATMKGAFPFSKDLQK